MKIALDIDGCFADFAPACNGWLASHLGVERAPIDRWDWYENYGQGSHAAWNRFWNFAQDNPFFATLPVIDGAMGAYKHLVLEGHNLTFLTNRNPRYYGVQTRTWLRRHGMNAGVIHTDDKGSWANDFDLLVEDAPHNLDAWRNNGGQTIRMARSWNIDYNEGLAALNWGGVVATIEALSNG